MFTLNKDTRLYLMTLLVGLFLGLFSPHEANGLVWKVPPDVFSPGPNGGDFSLAADPCGNAFTAWTNNGDLFVSRFSNITQTYGPFIPLSIGGTVADLDIATDATGTALLVWSDITSNAIFSAYFNGTLWVIPTPFPIDIVSSGSSANPQVAMDGSGNGVAIWADTGGITPPGDIIVSFFDPTTISWGPLQTLNPAGTGGWFPNIDLSGNGTAVAVWTDAANNVVVSNYNGVTWSAIPQIVGINAFIFDTQIDADGNALTLWVDLVTEEIFSSFFNGSSWSAPENVSDGIGIPLGSFDFDMAPNGYAIAVWADGPAGYYSEFIGGTWTAPLAFASDVRNTTVAVDSNGNSLIVYNQTIGNGAAFSIYKPIGGPLGLPDPLGTDAETMRVVIAALSDNGRGFVDGGNFGDSNQSVVGTYTLLTIPSPLITGRTCKNNFATQSDRIHIISFVPSSDPSVFAYYLTRNGVLIAILPATGPFFFEDHNRCRSTDVYSITAVTTCGNASTPSVVILR